MAAVANTGALVAGSSPAVAVAVAVVEEKPSALKNAVAGIDCGFFYVLIWWWWLVWFGKARLVDLPRS